MTVQEHAGDGSKAPGNNAATDPHERDGLLQALVRLANGDGTEGGFTMTVSLTIVLGGTVLSGQLISEKEYFRRFGDAFADGLQRAGLKEESAKDFGKMFLEAVDGPSSPSPRFLHLANTVIVHAGGPIPTGSRELSLWRGRISAVGAFVLGSMSSP